MAGINSTNCNRHLLTKVDSSFAVTLLTYNKNVNSVASVPSCEIPSARNTRRPQENNQAYGAPGFAWAARREVIPEGLYDLDIVGGGDCHQLAGWLDETMYVQKRYAGMKDWSAEFLEWKKRQLPRVKSQIGCVPGNAFH